MVYPDILSLYLTKVCSQRTESSLSEVDEYLYRNGLPSDAILYSTVFLPEFVLVEDSILLAQNPSRLSSFKREVDRGIKSRSLLEWAFNIVEVRYLFLNHGDFMEEEEELILADRIEKAWRGWLQVCFPDRKFVVEQLTPEESGDSTEVRFYQDRGYTIDKD